MFAKKLTELTLADIQSVKDQKIQEDQEIEFKEALSTPKGRDDVWITGGKEIGTQAKAAIARELIAFANTMGGTLILGIVEDGEGRAIDIMPLPKCRELADRLASSVASSTDPKMYGIEYAGVEMIGEAGVVVLRVAPSARAPHRDNGTRDCYYRSGTKSEVMDMHRIQAMAVEKWRGLQLIETRLKTRAFEFEQHFDRQFPVLVDGGNREPRDVRLNVSGIRATAVPTEGIYIPDISRRESLKLLDPPLFFDTGAQKPQLVHQPELIGWTPILRGIKWKKEVSKWARLEERIILSDGLIEIKFKSSECFNGDDGDSSRELKAFHLLEPVAQFLIMVESFRCLVGRPDLEFAISIEWRIPRSAVITLPDEQIFWSEKSMRVLDEINTLPDLVMPSRERIPEIWNEIQTEFFHSFGRSYGNIFPVIFDDAVVRVIESGKARQ